MATFVLLDGDTTFPLFVSLVAALAIAGLILALSFVLAVQSPDPEKTSAYECGFEPFEDARNRFDVRFYIVAILFLLFDIEVAFLFPWAATLGRTGGTSFAIVALFLLLLTAGFLYEVIKGALNPHLFWAPISMCTVLTSCKNQTNLYMAVSAIPPIPLVSLTLNGRPIQVRASATLLQACEASGVDVPRFCYHPALSVAGNCRRCLVEVQKSPKPVVACARPVAPGRVVFTDTPLVRKAREAVLEFLLLNHPLDCPICDQGGECDLQDEALTFGADRGRAVLTPKRGVQDKECGPIVKTIRTRCIHCTRCVRFAAEVAGVEALGSFGRGGETEIGPYLPTLLRTELSGHLVDLCPVGALTSKPYARQARPWELQRNDSVDPFDAIGRDLSVHTRGQTATASVTSIIERGEEILRILPRTTPLTPEPWISDRSRYAFDAFRSASRLIRPEGPDGARPWSEVLLTRAPGLAVGASRSGFRVTLGFGVSAESIFATSLFTALRGRPYPRTSNGRAANPRSNFLSIDAPEGLGLPDRRELRVASASAFVLVGTDIRTEASFLSTRLRREQRRRPLTITSLFPFTPQRLRHLHLGSSIATGVSLLENRLPVLARRLSAHHDEINRLPRLLLGAESLRGRLGSPLEGLFRSLARRRFSRRIDSDRVGVVHATSTSLAAAVLGVTGRSSGSIAPTPALHITVGLGRTEATQAPRSIHLGTHSPSASDKNALHLPLPSPYERTEHRLVLDGIGGRLRRSRTAVTAPRRARSTELLWSALIRRQGHTRWRRWTEGLAGFHAEIPLAVRIETSVPAFLNTQNAGRGVGSTNAFTRPLAVLTPGIRDIYLQDPVSLHSPTRGECSLFLGGDGSFQRER